MERKESQSATTRIRGRVDDVFGHYCGGKFGSVSDGNCGDWGMVDWMEVVEGVNERERRWAG